MKKILLALLVGLPLWTIAQSTSGKIVYDETVQLQIDIPEEHRSMIGSLPTSQSNQMVLYFNGKESMYKNLEKNEDQSFTNTNEGGDVQIKMVIAVPENAYYKNLETEKQISQQEFFGKKFLIQDQIEPLVWKLTNEQKVILNYPCVKAILQDTSQTVEAWFTAQIPVSSGPDSYGQLPGMILELSVNDGERLVVAKSVDFETPDPEKLKAPKKGKKVTKEEYEKIVDKRTKEMEEEMGGRGTRIRIRN